MQPTPKPNDWVKWWTPPAMGQSPFRYGLVTRVYLVGAEVLVPASQNPNAAKWERKDKYTFRRFGDLMAATLEEARPNRDVDAYLLRKEAEVWETLEENINANIR